MKGGQIGSVYKQPETEVDDSCHNWRVPSKWKGYKGGAKGSQKGEQRGTSKGSKGNCAMYICKPYCMCKGTIERLNDISYRVHNNNNRNECC